MSGKKKLLIYTGHNELIGGDVFYMFNILNELNYDKFSIELFTDVNEKFQKRAEAWLKVEQEYTQLKTAPTLFKKFWLDEVYEKAEQKNTGISKIVYGLLSLKLGKIKMLNVLRYIFRRIVFRRIRWWFKNFFVFYKIFKQRKGKVDIFHFNNGGYPAKEAGLIAMIVAKLFKVPNIIMTFHNIPAKRSRPIDYFYDFIISRITNQIISASRTIADEMIRLRKFPEDLIVINRCGLPDIKLLSDDEKTIIRQGLDIRDDQLIITISGNIEEKRKGHEELFDAMAIVKVKVSEVLLFVIGDGSKERMNLLRDKVKRLELEENVRFLGYRTDIYELNSIAEFTLTPSVGVESIPFTILEGARLAKPVITTTAGACNEGVIDNKTGYVVEPFDIQALADRMITLLHDKDIRLEMGKNGRQFFLDRFLLKKTVLEHEKIYLAGEK